MNRYLERMEYLVGEDNVKKLQNAKVMVCGVGGVGSFVAEALARSGVGHLILVDFDVIDESNLNRQLMTDKYNVGKSKVLTLKKRLEDISMCKVETRECFIDEDFVVDRDLDYVADCIDILTSKFSLIRKCHEAKVRCISSMGTAKRLDPSKITYTTLDKTKNDPLAKALRGLVKKENYRHKIEVVYIDSPPLKTENIINEGHSHKEKYPLGSAIFTVGSAGLRIAMIIASKIMEDTMKFKDFKYERIEMSSIEKEYGELLEALKKADNKEEFQNVFDKISKYRGHIMTMQTLCSVRHTIDTSDKFYSDEQDYWDNTSPMIQKYENELSSIVLACPFRDELDIPKTYYMYQENAVKSFNENIIEDMQLENKLVSEYSKLKSSAKIEFEGEIYNLASIQSKTLSSDRDVRKRAYGAALKYYEDNEAEFDRIYDELVKVRDRMAKKLGFKNFVELGYLRMNRLDYDADMVANYRRQVLEDIVPLCNEIYRRQKERLGLDELMAYDLGYEFESGNPKPHGSSDDLVMAAKKMYEDMSKDTGEFFNMMIDMELFDLLTKPNKDMGGYCTELPDYKVPFIFANFNGTAGDVDVLTHEAGHAFQSYMTNKYNENLVPDCSFPTMESCEIHSMSMEFFAHPWMENFFKEDTDKYIYSHVAGALTFLPYGVLVDHFQHEVYEHPEMSIDERKATWRRLEKMYCPERNYAGFDLLERGGYFYRQGHIFASPFYYIDYTLAQVCALQFYSRTLDKDENTWNDYIHLCKLGGTKPFLGLLEEAHIKSPFEDGCLKGVAKNMMKVLDSIDDKKL